MGEFYSKHIGEVYERLTITEVIRNPKPKFVCKCTCGGEVTTDVHSVLSKKTQSCGCLRLEIVKESGKKNLRPLEVGKTFENRKGLEFKIVEYVNSTKVKVKFTNSGYEVYAATKEIKKGSIRDWLATPLLPKPVYVRVSDQARMSAVKVGEIYTNHHNCQYEIIELLSNKLCKVKFLDEFGFERVVARGDAKKGIRNPFNRLVAGVGYLGDGDYSPTKDRQVFNLWSNMLIRCYDEQSLIKQPTYEGCQVHDYWQCFQNFAPWCYVQKEFIENKDWCLDKDILIKGNKLYSEDTCSFVPRDINNMFTLRIRKRGSCPLGVHWDNTKEKYVAQLNRNHKRKFLGYFTDPLSAFSVYKQAKEEYIKEVAETWKNKIDVRVYASLINWTIEVTD
jgi:hypothetical protein